MKKLLIVMAAALLVVSLCSLSYAAVTYDWAIPDNVRIVQKDHTDGVRIFSSIQNAISSITGASANNRFIVKVMPGEYNEQVTMKEYVDLEGSGDNTVITKTVISDYPISSATLVVAHNTTVKNIKVINDGATGGYYALAVLFNEVTAKAEGLIAFTNGTASNHIAVMVNGSSANVTMDNIFASSVGNGSGNSYIGIRVVQGYIDISRSRISASGGQWAAGIYDGSTNKSKKLRNSVVEASNSPYTHAIYMGYLDITGSKIRAFNCGLYECMGMADRGESTIVNSEIIAEGSTGLVYGIWSADYVASTLIVGGVNTPSGVYKLVNCYDGNFNPIPNQ